ERVAVEEGGWEGDFGESEVAHDRALGQLRHGQADERGQGEHRIHQPLTEGLGLGEGRVEVQGLGVHGHGGEPGVVRLGDGAAGGVPVRGTDFHLVQPQTSLFDDSVTHVSLLTHGDSSLSPFAWALRTRGRFGRLLLIMGINRTLYVVTHPQSQHHVDGLVGWWFASELSALGAQQAGLIASELRRRIQDWAAVEVFSSDLRRTRATADAIAQALPASVEADAFGNRTVSGLAAVNHLRDT